jgi:hypothetical protein
MVYFRSWSANFVSIEGGSNGYIATVPAVSCGHSETESHAGVTAAIETVANMGAAS